MDTGGFTEKERSPLADEREEALVVEQIKYLQSELCSIQSSFLAIISVSLGAYGLIIYYALSQDVAWLFILLPFLFSLSFYNILKYTAKMMGLDAYVSYLESLSTLPIRRPFSAGKAI